MTPEAIESRLRSLRIPQPPERLRERCLASHRGSRRPLATFAVAASFLVVGLSVWLIATQRPSVQSPDKILPPAEEPSPPGADPVLKDKIDRLLRENPGKAVLVVRVRELRDGSFRPVTSGVTLTVVLQVVGVGPDPVKKPDELRAEVDLDGTILFVVSPGRYRSLSHLVFRNEDLKNLCFVWNFKGVEATAGQSLQLSDALLAPFVEWTVPANGETVSILENRSLTWAAYPELRRIQIHIERTTSGPVDSGTWTALGTLMLDAPKDHGLPLSVFLNGFRKAVNAGDRLSLRFTGFDAEGREFTRTKVPLEVRLKE
jgi:hypothetical protein